MENKIDQLQTVLGDEVSLDLCPTAPSNSPIFAQGDFEHTGKGNLSLEPVGGVTFQVNYPTTSYLSQRLSRILFDVFVPPFPYHFCGLNFLSAFAHRCQFDMASSLFLPPTVSLTTG